MDVDVSNAKSVKTFLFDDTGHFLRFCDHGPGQFRQKGKRAFSIAKTAKRHLADDEGMDQNVIAPKDM